MPGCVLRVGSKPVNVEALVKASGLQPVAIHRKGSPRVPGGTVLSPSSGFNVDVSRADTALEAQVRGAIAFLKRHATGLARLRRSTGFGGMVLDFGVSDRRTANYPWLSYRLPANLIETCGKAPDRHRAVDLSDERRTNRLKTPRPGAHPGERPLRRTIARHRVYGPRRSSGSTVPPLSVS